LKCGCVIAKDGQIIATAFNSQRNDKDASAHDGIKAARLAGQTIDQKDLVGCIAFCTHEPCTMCLSAMVFAKIEALYFGIPLDTVSDLHKRIAINAEELLAKSPRPMRLFPRFMESEVRSSLPIQG